MRTKKNLVEPVVIGWTLNAPVERVWKELTDQMRQWYFDLKEFKAEVGFEFEFVGEYEGNHYHDLCRVAEVIPQRRTRLKPTHSGIETFPKTPAYARRNFEAGWTQIVHSELRQFVEQKQETGT